MKQLTIKEVLDPALLPMRYKSSDRDFSSAKNERAGKLAQLFGFK